MAHLALDLGQLDLVSTTSGLKLQVSSSAHLARSAEDVHDSHDRLTTTALTSSTSDRPWVTRANNYAVTVQVVLSGNMGAREREVLASISDAITHAKIWEQLTLEPIQEEASEDPVNEPLEITLFLKHSDTETTDEPRKQHKLSDGVPIYDVRPPSGFPFVQLRRVILSLHFTADNLTKRRKLKPSLSESHILPGVDGDDMLELEDELLKLDEKLEYQQEAVCWTLHSRRVQTAPTYSSPEPIINGTKQAQETDSFYGSSPSLKRSYSTSDVPSNREDASATDFVDLFDAAIRYAVTTSPKDIPKAIQLMGNESLKHLADVFPVLWMPGYLSMVSAKAVMLPTISRALSNVCGVKARSKSLKHKLAELARRVGLGAGAENVNSAEQKSISRFQSALHVRLWQTLQIGTLNNESARNLKPVRPTGLSPRNNEGNDEGDILEFANEELTHQEGNLGSEVYDSRLEDGGLQEEDELDLDWFEAGPCDYDCRPESSIEDFDPIDSPECGLGHEPATRGTRVADVDEEMLSVCESVDSLALVEDVDSMEQDHGFAVDLELAEAVSGFGWDDNALHSDIDEMLAI